MDTRDFSARHTTPHAAHTPQHKTQHNMTHHNSPQQHDRNNTRRQRHATEERGETIHFQCGGAWPFFVDGVLFLVNPVCARDLCLLNSVKYDSSLISFSASWQVNNFLISANYLFYAGTVFIFVFFFCLCSYSFKIFRII